MNGGREPRLNRFYELLAELESRVGGKRRLLDCGSHTGWPARGVYFFFEPGELREDVASPRVVRVGTHALHGTSKSTLWGRLSQHRGNIGGMRPGGGNHRGSIFRLHVGAALLARDDWPEAISDTWKIGHSASAVVRAGEYPLELAVSAYIGSMPLLWLGVDDAPGSASDRGRIERGSIQLLSNLRRPPIDPPSPAWLGHLAPNQAVRGSGLWNVRHVDEIQEEDFFETFGRWIGRIA